MFFWQHALVGLAKRKIRRTYEEDRDQNKSEQTVNVDSPQNMQTISENPDYCPNCGSSLSERKPVQNCPYCGITIRKATKIILS